jgi:hypothetical protein
MANLKRRRSAASVQAEFQRALAGESRITRRSLMRFPMSSRIGQRLGLIACIAPDTGRSAPKIEFSHGRDPKETVEIAGNGGSNDDHAHACESDVTLAPSYLGPEPDSQSSEYSCRRELRHSINGQDGFDRSAWCPAEGFIEFATASAQCWVATEKDDETSTLGYGVLNQTFFEQNLLAARCSLLAARCSLLAARCPKIGPT